LKTKKKPKNWANETQKKMKKESILKRLEPEAVKVFDKKNFILKKRVVFRQRSG
jgi:hypothetical protein